MYPDNGISIIIEILEKVEASTSDGAARQVNDPIGNERPLTQFLVFISTPWHMTITLKFRGFIPSMLCQCLMPARRQYQRC